MNTKIMDDRVLYQPSTLTKRDLYPGVIILHTPPGALVDMDVPIITQCYTLNKESREYEEISNLEQWGFGFNYNMKKQNSTKKIKYTDILWTAFIDRVKRNDYGTEYKSFVVFQTKIFTKEFSIVQAVKLTFTLTNGDTIITDFINFVQGNDNTKAFFTKIVHDVYDRMADDKYVDLVDLARDLPNYTSEMSIKFKTNRRQLIRHHNPKSTMTPIKMIAPKVASVQENTVYFVLFEKQHNRPESDFLIEQFFVEPADCGFNMKLVDSTSLKSIELNSINTGMYQGKHFYQYYAYISKTHSQYYIVPFLFDDIQNDSVVHNITLTLQLPFNTKFSVDVTLSRDMRCSIVNIDNLMKKQIDALSRCDFDPSYFGFMPEHFHNGPKNFEDMDLDGFFDNINGIDLDFELSPPMVHDRDDGDVNDDLGSLPSFELDNDDQVGNGAPPMVPDNGKDQLGTLQPRVSDGDHEILDLNNFIPEKKEVPDNQDNHSIGSIDIDMDILNSMEFDLNKNYQGVGLIDDGDEKEFNMFQGGNNNERILGQEEETYDDDLMNDVDQFLSNEYPAPAPAPAPALPQYNEYGDRVDQYGNAMEEDDDDDL